MDDRADLIYHETQQAALCGVHALNTLLQAPHFSEVELAQIAHELDAAEHALMASGDGGVESAHYLEYVAEGSGNVAADGMFSIQVLSKALEVFGLQAVPLTSPDASAARADPTSQAAFICNLQEHWFTIRSIHGAWWNLNSVFSSPEPLSEFYLAAFLDSLKADGYTIFVINGPLPPSQPPDSDAERFVPGQAGRWFTPEEARAATKEREELKNKGFVQAAARTAVAKASGGEGRWMVLRRPGANKRSLEEGQEGGNGSPGEHDDPELAAALAASLGQSSGAGASKSAWGAGRPGGATAAAALQSDEDADLAAAIAASLAYQSSAAGSEAQPPEQQQEQPVPQQQQGGWPAAARPARMSFEGGGFSGTVDLDEDPELAAAIAASLEQHAPPAGGQQQEGQEEQEGQQQQQQQEALDVAPAAPALQLPELGEEPEGGAPGVIEVALRLPGGGRASRRFRSGEGTVGHLAAFAAQQGADMAACQLAAQFPRRVFGDWDAGLAAAGVGDKELVVVEPK